MWLMTFEMWHATCYMWHVTHDTWHMWQVRHDGRSIFSHNFSSLALMVWGKKVFWRHFHKGWPIELMNQLIIDKSVRRTALVTQGLSIILVYWWNTVVTFTMFFEKVLFRTPGNWEHCPPKNFDSFHFFFQLLFVWFYPWSPNFKIFKSVLFFSHVFICIGYAIRTCWDIKYLPYVGSLTLGSCLQDFFDSDQIFGNLGTYLFQ